MLCSIDRKSIFPIVTHGNSNIFTCMSCRNVTLTYSNIFFFINYHKYLKFLHRFQSINPTMFAVIITQTWVNIVMLFIVVLYPNRALRLYSFKYIQFTRVRINKQIQLITLEARYTTRWHALCRVTDSSNKLFQIAAKHKHKTRKSNLARASMENFSNSSHLLHTATHKQIPDTIDTEIRARFKI